jgi:hypothetical protein
MQTKLFTLFILVLCTTSSIAQARLTIVNNSMRDMTVKIMQGPGKGSFYESVQIAPYSQETVRFYASGTFFTKSKAVIFKKDPIYKKGKSFKVTSDETGYSVLTLTFTIKESAVVESNGQSISKAEFDQN